jgi:hypothetical protein
MAVGDRTSGIARLLTLLASARPADIPGVLSLLDEADLARGVADPAAELSPLVAEHLVGSASRRVAEPVFERLAAGDPLAPAPDASGGVLRLYRERFLPPEPPTWRSTMISGRGRSVLTHPAPDFATVRTAYHGYCGPRQQWQVDGEERRPELYRALMIRGLERGTLDPHVLLGSGLPVGAVVELAAHDTFVPADGRVDRARRGRADIAWEMRQTLAEAFGGDAAAWRRILTEVHVTAAPFRGLVSGVSGLRRTDQPVLSHLWDRWAVTNILLALAPPDVACQLLTEVDAVADDSSGDPPPPPLPAGRFGDVVFALVVALQAPLSRAVVEYVLADPEVPGARQVRERQREELARNPATPVSVLRSLLTPEFATPQVCGFVYRRLDADAELCAEVLRVASTPERRAEWYASLLPDLSTPAQLAPLMESRDAAWVHEVVRLAAGRLDTSRLLRCYAHLADLAGLEPVWAVELARAGTTEWMHPAVRASVDVGEAGPLFSAAAREPWSRPDEAPRPVPGRRGDDVLDDPLAWPVEDAVRAHLDGRPGRWRDLVRVLLSGADDPLPGLIAACARTS